jgi:hypothetical protein
MATSTYQALRRLWIAPPGVPTGLVESGDKFTHDAAWPIPVVTANNHANPAQVTHTAVAQKIS